MEDREPNEPPVPSSARFWHHYRRYPYLLAKIACWGLIIYAIVWALQNVQSVLFPLFLSLLIAYCLDPLVDWFEARGWSRTLAIILLITVALLGMTGFVLILQPALVHQFAQVGTKLPALVTSFQSDFIPYLHEKGVPVPETWAETVKKYGDEFQDQIPNITKKMTQWGGSILTQTGALVASLLNIVMIPVFSFYFLRDFDRMKDPLVDFIPEHRREFVLSRIKAMDQVVGAWFRGQVEVALILAALYAFGLGLVFHLAGIGMMTGIAVGVLAGLLNVIPYFGFLIGAVLSSLFVLLNWDGPLPAVGLIIVFSVVQGLEGYVITPKVVGDKVGLSPVTVIIVLLLGGELFGLLGVLLAIPVAGIVRALLPDMIAYYQSSAFFTNEFRGPEEEDDWMSSIKQIRMVLAETSELEAIRPHQVSLGNVSEELVEENESIEIEDDEKKVSAGEEE